MRNRKDNDRTMKTSSPQFDDRTPWRAIPPTLDEDALRSLASLTDSSSPSYDSLPQIQEEIDADSPLAERIAFQVSDHLSEESFKEPDTRPFTFLGIRLPAAYRKLSWPAFVLALLTSRRGVSLFVSIIVHLGILILLALIVFRVQVGSWGEPIQTGFSESEDLSLTDETGDELSDSDILDFTPLRPTEEILQSEGRWSQEELQTLTDDKAVPSKLSELSAENALGAGNSDGQGLTKSPQKMTSGRTAETRRHGLPGREGDTTDKSEAAVEAGLRWLAAHQLPDGGWSFDLTAADDNGRPGECQGACSNSFATAAGSAYRSNLYPSRMAATGIALLAFLGAGYDHQKEGVYQKTVAEGINYLVYRAVVTPQGADFREGGERYGMYTQSIVALTICEAYELTKDPQLQKLAEEGIRLITASQHEDGGWRYEAAVDANFHRTVPGDTSVSGWQMLALKSAVSNGFELPPEIFYKVGYFLDAVGDDNNSLYRYQPMTNEPESKMRGTTAVGLLLREYLGWDPKRKEIKKGVRHLTDWFNESYNNWKQVKRGKTETKEGVSLVGPDGRFYYNLYFAYYAALALHHHGGKEWHRTFAATRDFLIETQNSGKENPHETGSWLFDDQYLNDGGRLLNTALSVLILETPYRYLPMYQ